MTALFAMTAKRAFCLAMAAPLCRVSTAGAFLLTSSGPSRLSLPVAGFARIQPLLVRI